MPNLPLPSQPPPVQALLRSSPPCIARTQLWASLERYHYSHLPLLCVSDLLVPRPRQPRVLLLILGRAPEAVDRNRNDQSRTTAFETPIFSASGPGRLI